MARLHGVKERRHQPFYDTLVRTTGTISSNQIGTSTKLFGNANVGTVQLTNLQVPGQLASDQTYVILALRCYLYFNGTNRRANYVQVTSQLFFTLIIGDKPTFSAPCWYYPAGGGIWGFDSQTSVFNHGSPGHDAILKLARPILVPVRQNFIVSADFYKIGTTDALTNLNTGASDDEKLIMFMLDGLQTRDVQ